MKGIDFVKILSKGRRKEDKIWILRRAKDKLIALKNRCVEIIEITRKIKKRDFLQIIKPYPSSIQACPIMASS